MCECYQIGGRFIAEDPDCPVHGAAAQREADARYDMIAEIEADLESSDPAVLRAAAQRAIDYLRSL